MLAALVRSHRRNVSRHAFEALPDRLLVTARRLSMLLRLAVLLHRSHEADPINQLELLVDEDSITLQLDPGYLSTRPLLQADLLGETQASASLGFRFHPGLD